MEKAQSPSAIVFASKVMIGLQRAGFPQRVTINGDFVRRFAPSNGGRVVLSDLDAALDALMREPHYERLGERLCFFHFTVDHRFTGWLVLRFDLRKRRCIAHLVRDPAGSALRVVEAYLPFGLSLGFHKRIVSVCRRATTKFLEWRLRVRGWCRVRSLNRHAS